MAGRGNSRFIKAGPASHDETAKRFTASSMKSSLGALVFEYPIGSCDRAFQTRIIPIRIEWERGIPWHRRAL